MPKEVARAALFAVALIGAYGLFLFGQYIWTGGRVARARLNNRVHHELSAIFAPEPLIDFAKKHNPDAIETNAKLRQLIEHGGFLNCWMVALTRQWPERGDFTDVPMIIRPGQLDQYFDITKDYLRVLAGRPPSEFRTGIEIIVIPDRLAAKDPKEALKDLLDR